MHIVGLQSVDTHKKEEKATSFVFFQANIMDRAVVGEENVFKCNY